jgi:hopanoid C-2 methylase
MRTKVEVQNQRRILCLFPAYTPSFGTFSHAYKLMPGVRAFMPPQGLLLIAAYMPAAWEVRFIDENSRAATRADLDWADAVLVSGMHIQAPQIRDIHARVKAAGKVTALGGPSVSAAPEMYPDIDYLHLGELGDATDALIERLDASVAPPAAQVRLEARERVPLCDFPVPAYDLVRLRNYLVLTLQFSSGCPYRCEFCDIPGLYGRQPRLKTPQQIIRELDAMRRQPDCPQAVYFVDDNFIGNRKATREMLPHLVEWQRKHDYPMQFSCEATLNIAKQKDILGLMQTARFLGIFVGIETPEEDALTAMRKEHNVAVPMLESIKTLNDFGLEITSGVILGLDTDSADSESRMKDFITVSNIPTLTLNLLQALPKTPLWDRLKTAGRLTDDPALESNVRFLRPYDEVVSMWRRCIAFAYDPERLFERFSHQVETTYRNRIKIPARGQLTFVNLKFAAQFLIRLIYYVGIKADYRRPFWRAAWRAIRRGQIDMVFSMGFVGHHLIEFSREALRGDQNASFYSARRKQQAIDDSRQPAVAARLQRSA